MEQIAAVLPAVWDTAEGPVVELIALLLSTNAELADADENGTVEEHLQRKARRLLHTMTLNESITVVSTLAELIGDAIGGGAVGEAIAEATQPQTPQSSASNSPTSSPSSPAPAAGAAEPSSTESPTAS